MAGLPSASAIETADYAAIEATIAATERGRWFLSEHGRRARAEETRSVLAAIERLEQAVTTERPPALAGSLRGGLVEMAEAISRTKAEITAISDPGADRTRLATASQALDAIVRSTELATSEILGAAEAVQEAAWTLRERHIETEVCETLDRHATAIYTACSFQDLTAQRIARIIDTLRYLEDRIAAMIAIWGSEADRIPPPPEAAGTVQPTLEELCQLDVDRYIDMGVPAVTAAALSARPGGLSLHEDIVFVPVTTLAEAAEPLDTARTEQPEAFPVEEPETVSFKEPEASPVEEPEAVSAEEPEAVSIKEPEAAPVEEPEAASADALSLEAFLADPPVMTFADLDGMSAQERLARFA